VTLQVRFDPQAVDELRAARDWYDEANPGLGGDFVDEVWRVIERIVKWPALAPCLLVSGSSHEVRRAPLRQFPFGVIYLVLDDVLWVVAIAHGRRRPGYWRERLKR
jgi:hypothetical protein